MLLPLLLLACADPTPPVSSPAPFDSGVFPADTQDTAYPGDPWCWTLAATDAEGARDDCDLLACETCLAACGGDCVHSGDSSGAGAATWTCPDGETWTADDACE